MDISYMIQNVINCYDTIFVSFAVITSYSIHYTKLYELFPSYKIRISGDAEKCLTLQKEMLEVLMSYGSVPIKSQIRITSYNVCYTKLLRAPKYGFLILFGWKALNRYFQQVPLILQMLFQLLFPILHKLCLRHTGQVLAFQLFQYIAEFPSYNFV